MVVVIDDRENDTVIHKLYVRLGDRSQDEKGQAQVKRLQVGDYIIGDVAIEAKEINDLWKSILGIGRTRTINAQLADLVENYERPMLVVYGNTIKTYRPPGIRRGNPRQEIARAHSCIKAFKRDLYQRFPTIQFMQLDTMDEFVDWIVNLHQQQTIAGKLSAPTFVRKAKRSTLDPRVAALSGMPGITEEHAENLLSEFGSIPNILKSRTSQASLMAVPGIGRKKAKMILSLRDQYPQGSQ